MANTPITCRVSGPRNEVPYASPRFLQVNEVFDLGTTDLASRLCSALTHTNGRISIVLEEALTGFQVVVMQPSKIQCGYEQDSVNCLVELATSSCIQVVNLATRQAIISVNVRTGATRLFVEQTGIGKIVKAGLEPHFDLSGNPAGSDWGVRVEFEGKTHFWTCPEGAYQPGDTVRVRRTAQGVLIAL